MSEVHQVSARVEGIYLSDTAKAQLLKWLVREENNTGVRFSLEKTGCSGWSYVVNCVVSPQKDDVILPFESPYAIYVQKKDYPYLQGMTVDYVKSGLSYKFIYHNPNQKGQCGCGESISI